MKGADPAELIGRDQANVGIQSVDGVAEFVGVDLPRDEQPRLQGVRIGADEVVQDLIVTLAGGRAALVLDVEPDDHVVLEQLDDLRSADGAESVDVDELPVMDAGQLGAAGRSREARAATTGTTATEQRETRDQTTRERRTPPKGRPRRWTRLPRVSFGWGLDGHDYRHDLSSCRRAMHRVARSLNRCWNHGCMGGT